MADSGRCSFSGFGSLTYRYIVPVADPDLMPSREFDDELYHNIVLKNGSLAALAIESPQSSLKLVEFVVFAPALIICCC